MSDTAEKLRVVLGNTFVMYYHAHQAHWNVTGIQFHALHQFFGELYEELFDAVDPTAEQIRALDEMAPVSLAALVAPATIGIGDHEVQQASVMISELLSQNQLVLQSLYDAHDAALSAEHDGVVNFIEDRIDKHAKIGWKLKAHLQ